MWRRIEADGCEWEVRALARQSHGSDQTDADGEILEFQPTDRMRPPRQIAVRAGSLPEMDDAQLRAAYRAARPIGGDHYGRPGKSMHDSRGT